MMNGYIPLYGGGPQRAAMVSPEAASMPWRSLQQIAEGVDEAGKTWQRYAQNEQLINNFRQQNDFDRWLIDKQAEYKTAVAEDPMNYDQHITLARELKKRAEEWGAGYDWGSEEELLKYEARRNEWIAKFNASVETGTAERRMQDSERSWRANVDAAVERGDFRGAADIYGSGVGIFKTPEEGDAFAQSMSKKQAGADFNNLAATNPDLAAEKINRGELDGYFSAAEQEQMMRSLRNHDDDRLTDLINQAVSQPRGKDNRQAMASALLAGSPYEDELKFLSVYNRDQNFAACMPEIENFLHSLADDVAPGEEKDSLERKMTDLSRKCTFYQIPSDTKSRLLKRMEENAKRRAEYPKLNAVEYVKNATAGSNVKLYDPALYNERIGSLNQAANSTYALVKESYKNAGFSVPDRAKWGEKYAHDSINALEDELTNQTVFKVRVAFDTWHNAYKQDHGDKEPSITLQEDKLETLLRQFTGNQSFSLPGKFGQEADKAVKEADRAAENAYRQRKKSAPKLADDQTKKRLIPQKTFTFPATLSVDTVQTNAPAGILLPESMKKRFGDDLSHVAALVPSSPSSRRGRPLPVVGYTKAASPQLTLSGASKLRMTFSSRMNTHVSIVPAGKEMQEFFKREFLNQADSEAPSPDFGLVPDNGVETAEPVSGAYLNGDLTVLPPLN
nr:MAG TPA: hypothetical protein [Caudoviricetes sp.]